MINFFIQQKSICGVRRGVSVSVPPKIAAGFTSLTDKSEIVIHWLENSGILNLLLTFCKGQLTKQKQKTKPKKPKKPRPNQKPQAETIQGLAASPSSGEIKKLYISSSHNSPDHKGIASCSS